ncbi:hypothetical protein R1flu_002960 [Riccia fluitans]|uniref:Uncharacterized protein n=1 Tax=Riccia fluitans TaxID=41844 RepID=A0ABD1Y7M9_9MARC
MRTFYDIIRLDYDDHLARRLQSRVSGQVLWNIKTPGKTNSTGDVPVAVTLGAQEHPLWHHCPVHLSLKSIDNF